MSCRSRPPCFELACPPGVVRTEGFGSSAFAHLGPSEQQHGDGCYNLRPSFGRSGRTVSTIHQPGPVLEFRQSSTIRPNRPCFRRRGKHGNQELTNNFTAQLLYLRDNKCVHASVRRRAFFAAGTRCRQPATASSFADLSAPDLKDGFFFFSSITESAFPVMHHRDREFFNLTPHQVATRPPEECPHPNVSGHSFLRADRVVPRKGDQHCSAKIDWGSSTSTVSLLL